MSVTATTERAFSEVLRHAEKIRNDADHRIEVMEPGDAWAQGDILILRLKSLPLGAVAIKSVSQLAPGTTQGSRHCIADPSAIRMYRLAITTPLDGPILVAESEFMVEHPEHGNVTCPAGVYAIRYQRAFAEELKRQLD